MSVFKHFFKSSIIFTGRSSKRQSTKKDRKAKTTPPSLPTPPASIAVSASNASWNFDTSEDEHAPDSDDEAKDSTYGATRYKKSPTKGKKIRTPQRNHEVKKNYLELKNFLRK